jgi:hypothetical protein
MIKLTEQRKISRYVWVHLDEEAEIPNAPAYRFAEKDIGICWLNLLLTPT